MNLKNSIGVLLKTVPIIFPLAFLFHLLWLVLNLISVLSLSPLEPEWMPVWAWLVFGFLSFQLCYLKKWAALTYTILSLLSLIGLKLLGNMNPYLFNFCDAVIPLNLILSFFVLLYYNRFKAVK